MSIPKRGHETDAGIDLTAMSVEQKRAGVFLFDTGISIHLSDSFYDT
jgi:dUTPase